MARYIDADVLCKHFKILYEHAQTNGMYNHAKLYDRAFRVVVDAPTADVVPKSEYDAVVSAVDNSTQEFLKLHDDYQDQKAEIERLQKHNTEFARKHYSDGYNEAVKKFSERLKEYGHPIHSLVDNLVKEMTEENNEL